MENFLHQFFAWLPQGNSYYLLLGLIAFSESLVAVGILMPGSTICVFAGFLALHGQGEIAPLIVVTAGGAFLGDVASFVLGARVGSWLLTTPTFRKRRPMIRRAELFFAEHGGKSVFFGRFFGPVRGFIPFVAGCAQMSPRAFLGYATVSAILWGLVYPGLGFLAGASWQNVETWSVRLSLLIGLALVVTIVSVLLRRWFR